MTKQAKPDLTRSQLLAACAAVEAKPVKPFASKRFRPGRGLPVVRTAIAQATDPGAITLALVTQLFDTEPWEPARHSLLEPLFDALQLFERVAPAKPVRETKTVRVGDSKVMLRFGDVAIQGDLEVRGIVCVVGSLRVSGAIRAYGDSWTSGTIVVLGDVRAKHMICLGPVAIGGTLALADGLYTEYFHDYTSTLMARRIETPVLIDRGDIAGRVIGPGIAKKLRFQRAVHDRAPAYFDTDSRKVDLKHMDRAMFRAVTTP